MKNRLVDMHNYFFAQLEKLADEDISGAELEREIYRAESMIGVGAVLLKGYDLAFKIAAARAALPDGCLELPPQLADMSDTGSVA